MARSLRLVSVVALVAIVTAIFASCGFPEYGGFGNGTGGGTSTVTGTGGAAPTGCSTNTDCANEPNKICNATTGMCVACVQQTDCAAGSYCSTTNQCLTGCMTDASCSTGVDGGAVLTCDPTTHTCQGCALDTDCQPGTVCETATTQCVPGCTGEQACATGRTCCNGQCLDLQADTAHCGACATPCTPPNGAGKCVDGMCAIGTCNTGFQDCNKMPADGCEVATGTDTMNCGTCANVCPALANSTPACVGGACGLGACAANFGNCDGNPANGCEANTQTSPPNCGGCGNACALANAVNGCAAGSCTIASCNPGFADCDKAAGDGCEVNTGTDPTNCGSCAHVCSVPNASPACTGGACAVGMCVVPFEDCNLMASDGCEVNVHTDPNNCGGCGTVCNLANATAGCSNGACTVVSCSAGFADCDGVASNGCEVNLGTSVPNCGSCGAACSANNGTPSCAGGHCAIACASGFADCDMNVANGCEVNTTNNVNNCASCGHACPVAGGTPACNSSVCGVSSCQPGRGDCDGNPANGCETDTTTSPQNCGGCGLACFVANGTAGCTASHCTVASCNPGFADCDGNAANGCETNLKTSGNCGGCGVTCALANGTSSCATGTCQLTGCTGSYADCDGIAANGCETNTGTNTLDCGSCNAACSTAHDSPTCSGGSCSVACAAGYGNCDANAANGCETATTNNVNACGSCTNVCAVLNGTPTCSGTTCAVGSCTAPFKDCDGQYANGCETNTGTSLTNCGTCGTTCSNANGTTSCGGGLCAPVCATGFGDCDGNKTNGCETNTTTSLTNCGACGAVCSLPNANTACQTSSCVITSCKAGFADCDLNPANGCETPLNTVTNCGACGVACSNANGTTSCAAGACAPVCTAGFGDCDGNKNNGCEQSLSTVADCGACGTVCALANAASTCPGETCTLGACNAGWGNCDGNAANGCETNTNTSNANCGGCGTVCSGLTLCSNGMCVSSCTAGTADCDMNPVDGCEVNTTTDDNHCGTCANACTTSQYCSSSLCTACGAGLKDCDHLSSNGCESTIATDPSNCGGCGTVCSAAANATAKCTASTCGIACNSGFSNCDGSAGNGCECTTSTCCGTSCQTTHMNGEGQNFYDCNPASTFNSVTALEACTAYAISIGKTAAYCSDGWECSSSPPTFVCFGNTSGTTCTAPCWGYSGSQAGEVATTCACPFTKAVSWD